jgi:hypothetical protein
MCRLPAGISEVKLSRPCITIVDKQRLFSIAILKIADILSGIEVNDAGRRARLGRVPVPDLQQHRVRIFAVAHGDPD